MRNVWYQHGCLRVDCPKQLVLRTEPKPGFFFYRGEGTSAGRAGVWSSEGGEWGGVLGEGQSALSPPARESGERYKLPSRVRARASAAKRFSRVLIVQSGLSRQLNVVNCSTFHSSKFCQGNSYEKQPMRLPRLYQWTIRHCAQENACWPSLVRTRYFTCKRWGSHSVKSNSWLHLN